MTAPPLRLFVLRVVPAAAAAVLALSVPGGLATSLDGPYHAAAVAAAVMLAVVAAAPTLLPLLPLRVVAVSLAALAWLGRAAWFLSDLPGAFSWQAVYAVAVLIALTVLLALWAMAADWILLRGAGRV